MTVSFTSRLSAGSSATGSPSSSGPRFQLHAEPVRDPVHEGVAARDRADVVDGPVVEPRGAQELDIARLQVARCVSELRRIVYGRRRACRCRSSKVTTCAAGTPRLDPP